MLKKLVAAFPLYATVSILILGWWYLAFKPAEYSYSNLPPPASLINKTQSDSIFYIPNIGRQELKIALSGDFSLMASLIKNWDVDAQLLEAQGVKGTKRLGRNYFARSQLLGMQLTNSPKELIIANNNKARKLKIKDDSGLEIDLQNPFSKFLPQTFVAASFLLALADPEQIVALPRGLRIQDNLYSSSLTERIPLDIDRFNSEKIYLTNPEVAFVADYSHPTTVQALRNQGIQLFTIKSINTVDEIQDVLTRLGHVINRPLEAEMLRLFMDAAFLAIDNQLQAKKMGWDEKKQSPRLLFLTYHTHFAVPTTKTLTWQLLQRLGSEQNVADELLPESKQEWMIPIDQEKIVHYKPDCLIISTTNGASLKARIEHEKAFAGIASVCRDRIFFVDEDIQESPTQYIVLAYYDLAKALTNIFQ